MGYLLSKLKLKNIGIKFHVYSTEEIQIIKKLGYTTHPDKCLWDIIFVPQNTSKVISLDETFYFTRKNEEKWNKKEVFFIGQSTCIEIYVSKYCKLKEISDGEKKYKIWVYQE